MARLTAFIDAFVKICEREGLTGVDATRLGLFRHVRMSYVREEGDRHVFLSADCFFIPKDRAMALLIRYDGDPSVVISEASGKEGSRAFSSLEKNLNGDLTWLSGCVFLLAQLVEAVEAKNGRDRALELDHEIRQHLVGIE